MASTPAFTVTPRLGRGVLSAACTDWTGATTTNIVDILTGVSTGTKVDEIVLQADGDPADSVVIVFIHNGTDYRAFDYFDLGNPSASSTTANGARESRRYDNLWLPTGSFKLAAAITVVPTAGGVNIWAMGGDL